jgi:hypothetical protein
MNSDSVDNLTACCQVCTTQHYSAYGSVKFKKYLNYSVLPVENYYKLKN